MLISRDWYFGSKILFSPSLILASTDNDRVEIMSGRRRIETNNHDNDNRTPLHPRSLRSQSTRSTRSSTSSVSGLTTPNSSRGHQSNASETIHDATAGLLQLGVASVPSPLRRFEPDPLQQEEAIEGKMYHETPGNGDSEDEMEENNDDLDAQIDQLTHEFDERVATVESSDFIASGNPFQPALYGAPLG